MLNIQALIDSINSESQRIRAQTQMTLGELIATLENMPSAERVANLNCAHSYRGYYSDLAFECDEGTRPASDLLAECKGAISKVFEGYKGWDFVMCALTPVWVASYGCCGKKLMGVHAGGELETA